ncbi:MAG TPA: hypothetical protein VFV42_11480 [Acidimicrobiales bacterium]|nr:hypothetical protein [Acidimicrobiales bacterium]
MPADPHDDLEDLHELVSFEDPDEHRTWVFDVTFLTSPWTCVYGRGCPGVLTEAAPELEQGCCSYGAHFVDDDDHATTLVHISRLTPEQWQFHRKGTKDGATKRNAEGAWVTRMHKGACIMLNRPDHPGGAGCALHQAAVEAGERPLDWKPDVCWQLPLRLEESTDDHGHVTSTLREWKRRDWGDGGAEFHWWCTDHPLAFQAAQPAYEVLRDEIVEMVGETPYRLLVELLGRRRELGGTPVPHPALRRPVSR